MGGPRRIEIAADLERSDRVKHSTEVRLSARRTLQPNRHDTKDLALRRTRRVAQTGNEHKTGRYCFEFVVLGRRSLETRGSVS